MELPLLTRVPSCVLWGSARQDIVALAARGARCQQTPQVTQQRPEDEVGGATRVRGPRTPVCGSMAAWASRVDRGGFSRK